MRGRKPAPKPTFRVIQGGVPRLGGFDDDPVPPEWLTPEAQAEWRRVIRDLVIRETLARVDLQTLAAYCQAFGRWEVAERALAAMGKNDPLTRGLMIKTTNGNAVQNPMVGTANVAARDMVKFAAELGMTPVARARVEAKGQPAPTTKAGMFGGEAG